MAIWLARAGSNGEYERKFLKDGRIYFTWGGLNRSLGDANDLSEIYQIFREVYPDNPEGRIQNWGRQGSQFTLRMSKGDWVVTPSKFNPVIHFGKVVGDYEFNAKAEDPYYHSRKIEWFATDIPRERFDQDVLYSMGAFLTICKIAKNNAEERIKEMAANDWHVPGNSKARAADQDDGDLEETQSADLEEQSSDQISKQILAKFKGHGLARLVRAILEAQGYETYLPPEGPDKGIDILAAPGDLGFGEPRICVQVKCTDGPIERTVLDQLNGVMQNVNAQKGLLVSWGGFKQSIDRERANQFFRVRLWGRQEILNHLFETYEKLPESLRAELPLKRIWAVAKESE